MCALWERIGISWTSSTPKTVVLPNLVWTFNIFHDALSTQTALVWKCLTNEKRKNTQRYFVRRPNWWYVIVILGSPTTLSKYVQVYIVTKVKFWFILSYISFELYFHAIAVVVYWWNIAEIYLIKLSFLYKKI